MTSYMNSIMYKKYQNVRGAPHYFNTRNREGLVTLGIKNPPPLRSGLERTTNNEFQTRNYEATIETGFLDHGFPNQILDPAQFQVQNPNSTLEMGKTE